MTRSQPNHTYHDGVSKGGRVHPLLIWEWTVATLNGVFLQKRIGVLGKGGLFLTKNEKMKVAPTFFFCVDRSERFRVRFYFGDSIPLLLWFFRIFRIL